MHNRPNNFHLPESLQSFRVLLFEREFPWVFYYQWENEAYCLPCLLFGPKNTVSFSPENLYNCGKTFKKHQNAPMGTHKNSHTLGFQDFRGSSPNDWIFSSCVLWIMDSVICVEFLALMTVVAEIEIGKVIYVCSKRPHYLKRGVLVLSPDIFLLI